MSAATAPNHFARRATSPSLFERQKTRALHRQHRDAHRAAQQGEGIEKTEKVALIFELQTIIEMERGSQQKIAKGDAEHQGWDDAGNKKHDVPASPPRRRVDLAAKGQRDRTQDQAEENQHHREIKARERRRVEQRPGGENRPAAKNEPDLIAFPDRSDHVEQHAALGFRPGNERIQHGDAKIEAVHDGEADKQHAKQRPPNDAQGSIVEQHGDASFSWPSPGRVA